MLMIKLSKVGKTNKKVFRLIISEKSRDPFGRILENLGSYDPYTKELQVKGDRVKHWLSHGAKMTPTVNNLLVGKNIIEGEKVVASKPGKKSEKALAKAKAKEEKKNNKASEANDAPAPEETKEEASPAPEVEASAEEEKVDAVEESSEKEAPVEPEKAEDQ